MGKDNFGEIGMDFQLALIKVMIEDKKFGTSLVDVIEAKYFEGSHHLKYLVNQILEFHQTYNEIPNYNSLITKITNENINDTSLKVHLDTIKLIKDLEVDNIPYIQDTAMNFCKQQVLKRELKLVQKIIEDGSFERYKDIEKIIIDALQVGATTKDATGVFDDIQSVLQKDFRVPIPTGIVGLDNLLKGGVALGELAIVLAPTGIGKTTLLTLFANTGFNVGKNVLHIVFEDNLPSILRKHYTIWTGVAPDDLYDNREEIIPFLEKKQKDSKCELKVVKLPSDSTSVSGIKTLVRKLKSEGFVPELIVIDYVDCLVPDKNNNNYNEEWKGEGAIMRGLETMASEFQVAMWVATQGNRNSIASEIVTTDQMGGSIKKAQIGHVVISVGKTMEQKEHDLATLTLLKSRIGKDGIVFQNCTFNNEYLIIDTTTQDTVLGIEHNKEEALKQRKKEILEKNKQKLMNLEK